MSDLLLGSKDVGQHVDKVRQLDRDHHKENVRSQDRIPLEENIVDATTDEINEIGPSLFQELPGPERPFGGFSGIAGRNQLADGPDRMSAFTEVPVPSFSAPSASLTSNEVRRRVDLRPNPSGFKDCFSTEGLMQSVPPGSLEFGSVQSHINGHKSFKTMEPHGEDLTTTAASQERWRQNVSFQRDDKVPKRVEDVNEFGRQFQFGLQAKNSQSEFDNLPGTQYILAKDRRLVPEQPYELGGARDGGHNHRGGRKDVNTMTT